MDKNKRGRYPRAALANAPIYHYGHVRSIAAMREKNQQVGKYWKHDHPLFAGYTIDPQALIAFTGSHPPIVSDWLANEAEIHFSPDPNHQPDRRERRHRRQRWLEGILGLDLAKKHYVLINR